VRNVYHLLLYAWDHLAYGEEEIAAEAGFTRLQDLFAHVLATVVGRLLVRGLDRAYLGASETVAGVKGKLDVATTVKRSLLLSARTQCEFDELTYDVLHNRIIKATLRLLLELQLTDSVAGPIHRLYTKMDAVGDAQLRVRDFQRVQIHRNNRLYDFALRICQLIHENVMIEPGSGRVTFRDFRAEGRVMARLFEDFVFNFLAREQQRFRVSRPHIRWHDAQGTEVDMQRLPIMRTDVVLEAPDRCIILDTKYYAEALKGQYEQKKVDSSHLYQIFAYIENHAASAQEWPPHEGILLYPVTEIPFSFRYRLNGRPIAVQSINLDQPWQAVHEDLLAIVA